MYFSYTERLGLAKVEKVLLLQRNDKNITIVTNLSYIWLNRLLHFIGFLGHSITILKIKNEIKY